jgi:hypothetical protein
LKMDVNFLLQTFSVHIYLPLFLIVRI